MTTTTSSSSLPTPTLSTVLKNTTKNKILNEFKTKLLSELSSIESLDSSAKQSIVEFIDQYKPAIPEKKRKLTSTNLLPELRCLAKTENGNQCTSKKASKKDFCTLHKNSTPFGIIQGEDSRVTNLILTDEKLEGIDYFIDENDFVYSTEHILSGNKNPNRVGKKIYDLEKQTWVCKPFSLEQTN